MDLLDSEFAYTNENVEHCYEATAARSCKRISHLYPGRERALTQHARKLSPGSETTRALGEQDERPVADLTRADLRKWIAQLSREGLAPSSVARAVSAARGFFRFLMLDGHIKHHPAEDLDTPQKFSYLPKFLTEEEIDRLFATPDISTEEGIPSRWKCQEWQTNDRFPLR